MTFDSELCTRELAQRQSVPKLQLDRMRVSELIRPSNIWSKTNSTS